MGHITEGNNSNNKRTESNIQHKHTEGYVCVIQNCFLYILRERKRERHKVNKILEFNYLN